MTKANRKTIFTALPKFLEGWQTPVAERKMRHYLNHFQMRRIRTFLLILLERIKQRLLYFLLIATNHLSHMAWKWFFEGILDITGAKGCGGNSRLLLAWQTAHTRKCNLRTNGWYQCKGSEFYQIPTAFCNVFYKANPKVQCNRL